MGGQQAKHVSQSTPASPSNLKRAASASQLEESPGVKHLRKLQASRALAVAVPAEKPSEVQVPFRVSPESQPGVTCPLPAEYLQQQRQQLAEQPKDARTPVVEAPLCSLDSESIAQKQLSKISMSICEAPQSELGTLYPQQAEQPKDASKPHGEAPDCHLGQLALIPVATPQSKRRRLSEQGESSVKDADGILVENTASLTSVETSFFSWQEKDVAEFLVSLKLFHLVDTFQGVDGATLSQLGDPDLKEIGVTKLLDRKKVLGHVEKMKLHVAAAVASASPKPEIRQQHRKQCEIHAIEDGSAEIQAIEDRLADQVEPNLAAVAPLPVALQGSATDLAIPHLPDESVGQLAVQWDLMEMQRLNLIDSIKMLAAAVREAAQMSERSSMQVTMLAEQKATELKELLNAVEKQPELHVPLFGVTGAGKSTLINALLCEDAVPTSGWRACTSVPVELRSSGVAHESEAATGPKYTAVVHLKSREAWKIERRQLLTDLLMSDRQRVSRREPARGSSSASPAEVAYDTLRVVYPEAFMVDCRQPWPSIDVAERELDRIQNKVAKRYAEAEHLHFSGHHAAVVAQELLDFVDNPEAENEAAFWPIVERVTLCGPFPGAHPSVVLIDAPGVQDANGARSAIVGRLLKEAGGIIIAANVKRAASDRVARDMLGERFRRQLLMDGHYSNAMAFVATATDDIVVSELRRNLGKQAADLDLQDLALLRNKCAKDKILKDCFAGLRRIYEQSEATTRTDEELQRDGVAPAVFTTSARDYQRLRGLLSAEIDGAPRVWQRLVDTEIPQLRSWLYQQGHQASLAAQETWEQKLESICKPLHQQSSNNVASEVSRVGGDALKIAEKALEHQLDSKLNEADGIIRQTLQPEVHRGQQLAAEEARTTMASRCQPKGQGGMHHGTFQATCRRDGEWREDWNSLLSDPLNRSLAVRWNSALNKQVPQVIDDLVVSLQEELSSIQSRLGLPEGPFEEACDELRSQTACLKECVKQRQMELSRQVKEDVKSRMACCYKSAASQSGPGLDVRQKNIVRSHVNAKGRTLFEGVASFLESELSDLLGQLKQLAQLSVNAALGRLRSALRRHSANEDEQVSLRLFRAACADALSKATDASDKRKLARASLANMVGDRKHDSRQQEGDEESDDEAESEDEEHSQEEAEEEGAEGFEEDLCCSGDEASGRRAEIECSKSNAEEEEAVQEKESSEEDDEHIEEEETDIFQDNLTQELSQLLRQVSPVET
eukprot:TRINITY_DN785_c0_g1_i1.p1 TRINITY_DN785_c0_g1~~TRINITY_DN785_c0_g1_i1.p1  ORF type:complete len:1240 (+),score=300.00 TRINITY_DN785_c0_g1_i1:44-3763(+)